MMALRAKLRAAAQNGMKADLAHNLAHLDRVWSNAQTIASHDGGEMRTLLAGAYLHDLVNLPKDAPDRALASTLSGDKAMPILHAFGFASDEIQHTHQAIVAHSFSADVAPETHEARVIRDADRLDALGAIGIARTFGVAGALGRPLYDPGDAVAASRPLDDQQWSLDHWQVKLLHLSSGIMTKTGRTMAKARQETMVDYLRQLAHEFGTDLPKDWTT